MLHRNYFKILDQIRRKLLKYFEGVEIMMMCKRGKYLSFYNSKYRGKVRK